MHLNSYCSFTLDVYILSDLIFLNSYNCSVCLVNPGNRDGVLQPGIIGRQSMKKRKIS